MGRRTLSAIGIVIFLLAVIDLAWKAHTRRPGHYTLATGAPGGTYIDVGDAIVADLNNEFKLQSPPLTIGTIETAGAYQNLQAVQNGQADMALVQEGLPTSITNIRTLAPLYVAPLNIVVRKESGIRTIQDLRGHRVYIGIDGTGTKFISSFVLTQNGLLRSDSGESNSDVHVVQEKDFKAAADALIDRRIDAACFVMGFGSSALQELAKHLENGKNPFTLLNVDDNDNEPAIQAADPAITPYTLLKGTYLGFPDHDVTTIGVREMLVCNEQLSDNIAYNIVETLTSSEQLSLRFPLLLQNGPLDLSKAFYPYHSGAINYYKRLPPPSLSPYYYGILVTLAVSSIGVVRYWLGCIMARKLLAKLRLKPPSLLLASLVFYGVN